MHEVTILGIYGQARFPSQTCIDCEARGCFPCILKIQADIIQTVVGQRGAALSKRRCTADHKVRKAHSRDLTIEREGRGRVELRYAIQFAVNPAHTVSDLVRASDRAHVFGELKTSRVVCARRCAGSGDAEATGDREAHEFRNGDGHVDADIIGVEILRARFRNLRAIQGRAEIADSSVSDQIRVAENERMHSKSEFGIGECQ